MTNENQQPEKSSAMIYTTEGATYFKVVCEGYSP